MQNQNQKQACLTQMHMLLAHKRAQDLFSHCRQLESKQNTWNKYFQRLEGIGSTALPSRNSNMSSAMRHPSPWRQCSSCFVSGWGATQAQPQGFTELMSQKWDSQRIWHFWGRRWKRKEAGKERNPKINITAPSTVWLNTDLPKFRMKLYKAGQNWLTSRELWAEQFRRPTHT